jgi:hypothetical protein
MILFEKIILVELFPNIDHVGDIKTVKCIGTYVRTPGKNVVGEHMK